MIINAPADIAFSLFSIPIYWYGITMACAIFIAMITGNYFYNKSNPEFQKDIIIDYAFKKKSFRSFGYLLSPNN